MATNNSQSIKSNLDLYRNRAKKVDLTWCKQIASIIEKLLDKKRKYYLSDIGCNYGQFWKEIKRIGIDSRIIYKGYDIDRLYLELFAEFFPEQKNSISLQDIELSSVTESDIVICSATYEHLDNHKAGLRNLINSTKKILLLRTFLGNSDKFEVARGKGIDQPYNINQFEMNKIINELIANKFTVKIIPDEATNWSSEYEVLDNINRTMYILLCEKIQF